MMNQEGNILKVRLDEEDKQWLDAIVRHLNRELGVEVTISWVVRNLIGMMGRRVLGMHGGAKTHAMRVLVAVMQSVTIPED
jgi:hypothetical protein